MLPAEQRDLADLVQRVARDEPEAVSPADYRLLATLSKSMRSRRLDRETGRQIAAIAGVFDAARDVPTGARVLLRLLVAGGERQHLLSLGSSTRLIAPRAGGRPVPPSARRPRRRGPTRDR